MTENEETRQSKLQSLVKSRWYRFILLAIYPFFIGAMLLSFFGVPNWPIVRDIPEQIISAALIGGFIISAPALLVALKQHRVRNLEKYDPDSPEIQNLIRWLRKVGWTFASLAGIVFFSIFLLVDSEFEFVESDLFIPVISGSLMFCMAVSIFAFHFIGDIKSGMMAPPKWLIRMANSDKD